MSKDGDVVIVGTQGCTNGIDNGYVRIYRFENAKWTQQGQELGGEFSESSGSSVAISRNGRRVVIVKAEDFLRYESGNARAYEYNDIDQVWEQIEEDIQGGFNASNLSITTVDMNGDGDIIILGGPNNNDDDIDDRNEDTYYGRGNVRVYRYMEGNWIQQGQTIDGLTASRFSGKEDAHMSRAAVCVRFIVASSAYISIEPYHTGIAPTCTSSSAAGRTRMMFV